MRNVSRTPLKGGHQHLHQLRFKLLRRLQSQAQNFSKDWASRNEASGELKTGKEAL